MQVFSTWRSPNTFYRALHNWGLNKGAPPCCDVTNISQLCVIHTSLAVETPLSALILSSTSDLLYIWWALELGCQRTLPVMYGAEAFTSWREQSWQSFAGTTVTSLAFIHKAAKLILRPPVRWTRDPYDPFVLQRKTVLRSVAVRRYMKESKYFIYSEILRVVEYGCIQILTHKRHELVEMHMRFFCARAKC